MKKQNITPKTYELPSYWASALINDDDSGLEEKDIQDMNEWLERNQPGSCVEVSDESYFGRFNGLGCDMATYTFINF